MEHLHALARRTGYPGSAKLFIAARRAGLAVTKTQVIEWNRRQGARQIFEPVVPSSGKTAAEGPDERYQGDLLDFTAEAKVEGGHRYALALCNVFTRELYARPLKTKDPASVAPVLEAMVHALPAKPTFLLTDQGAEFKGPADAMLQRLGVIHRDKSPLDKNGLAVLDRAIQNLKGRLARLLAAGDHTDWAAALHEAVAGYNATYHSTVHGAPEDANIPDVTFMLFQDNAAKLAHNQRLAQTRLSAHDATFAKNIIAIRILRGTLELSWSLLERWCGILRLRHIPELISYEDVRDRSCSDVVRRLFPKVYRKEPDRGWLRLDSPIWRWLRLVRGGRMAVCDRSG